MLFSVQSFGRWGLGIRDFGHIVVFEAFRERRAGRRRWAWKKKAALPGLVYVVGPGILWLRVYWVLRVLEAWGLKTTT